VPYLPPLGTIKQDTMYIKLTLIFIAFILFSCQSDENNLEKSHWISTNKDFWSDPGTYLDLTDDDTLYLTQDFDFNNLESHSYHIDSLNNLILDDTLKYGTIIKRTNNILIIRDSLQTKAFILIRDYHIKSDSSDLKKLLLSNDWSLIEGTKPVRIEFYNEPWFVNPSRLKMYFRIDETMNWESFECEWWTLEQVEQSVFIILSIGQMDYQVYQVKEVSDSLILAETCWSDSIENVKIVVQPKLPDDKYSRIKNSLIGTWRLIDYSEPVDSSRLLFEEEIIPIKGKGRSRPYNPKDSVPILFDTYFQDKVLKYTFLKDGKCFIKKGDTILREGDWKLSDDGNYIKIQNGWMPSMRIITFSDSIMTSGKHETIEFEKSDGWKDKYIIEKMKKIE
jgi:hypothetical protein